ncbi:MAG TPA: hypothetical protein IAA22_05150 [Candidatus Olsenella stercoravium]|uniref:Uncharacterized protein n=1 Tax=Candidatus Olsenella stercoravium TaxID=2838713 RepID=A0A9D2DKH8_9ACTN|nr:hypothetical protein [Candidatus Olsenella stercoravium]
MAIENDGIVSGPAFAVQERDEDGLVTEVAPLVTITVYEYRELCSKAALWDEYRADVDRWAVGEADA